MKIGANMKILYGAKYSREDFEYSVRVKGTQIRFVQKGKEWFLVNSDFRVMGIGKSKEEVATLYYNQIRGRGQEGIFRLHNIESENHGRCSKQRCQEIFDEIKGNSNKGADVRNKMGSNISDIARNLHKEKYAELGKLSFKKYQYSGTVMLIVKVPDSSPMLDEGKEGKKANSLYSKFIGEVQKAAEPILGGYKLVVETVDSYGNNL
jgi:hypothetical protein